MSQVFNPSLTTEKFCFVGLGTIFLLEEKKSSVGAF